jgi:hypothetical protein
MNNVMNQEEIKAVFAKNWVFRVYNQNKISWYMAIAIIALVPLIIGMLFAIPLGVLRLYLSNFLTYSGPILIILFLCAYYWFYKNFPQKLEILLPAIHESNAELRRIVLLWANRLANRNAIMVIAGIPFGLVGLIDTITLWTTPTRIWMGTPWVVSSRSLFFASEYAFYYVLVIGFLIGSGVIGIAGTAFIINNLLRKPLKLDYYRRLRAVADLSLGIGTWTFVAFAISIIAFKFIKPSSNVPIEFTSILTSLIASLALLTAFLSPLLPANAAIIQAKKKKLAIYEERLSQISIAIEALIVRSDNVSKNKTKIYLDSLELLYKERSLIIQQVNEIESISSWPITFGKIARFTATAFMSLFLGQISNYLALLIKIK